MSGNRKTLVPATARTDLQLIELFSSLQGEGLHIGRREIFLRLAGCNLGCAYCDTPYAAGDVWTVEREPGSGRFESYPNPASLERCLDILDDWCDRGSGLHSALNLTGGEPLLQGEALQTWVPELRQRLPIHLETNGSLPAALSPLLPFLSFLSIDLKLADTCEEPTPWDCHREFLRLACHKPGQVKLVVGPAQGEQELLKAVRLVADEAPGYPIILQPLTEKGRPSVSGEHLLRLQEIAAAIHPETLVIPQVHPLLNLA
ncbi:MAG: radical SAM protein [Desulfuromonas sp.]|nr:MAG: radical SAM protein [Desulfuromonas sp.]